MRRNTADCRMFPADLLGHKRGVVIVSLDHNPTATLSWISMLIERNEDLCVLALGDRLDPELLVAAFDSGAGGYLLRDEIGPDAVLKSLELVLVGGVVVPQGFTRLLRNAVPQPLTVPAPARLQRSSKRTGRSTSHPRQRKTSSSKRKSYQTRISPACPTANNSSSCT